MPSRLVILSAILVCALIWGTTWYAITHQLGAVDPVASIAYRFGLAALVLFATCGLTGRSLRLSRPQHLAVAGQGLFVFAVGYVFVYWSEERIASAVVAVIFASLAFINLVLFRVLAGQKAAMSAWAGACLGVAGVGVLFAAELARTGINDAAMVGLGFAVLGVSASALGNFMAWRAQTAGVALMPATAWAMGYGVVALILFGVATGTEWSFDPRPAYVLSLLHLSLLGSVVAFVVYFWLARERGYALASYISALTPPVAMVVSILFEGVRYGPAAFAGLALVLAGQILLIRAPRKSDA